jgi:hypothetical protein
MAIVNRDLDVSQQKEVIQYAAAGAVATGATALVAVMPFPGALQSVTPVAYGVSNAMQVTVYFERWLAAGLTLINTGVSNIILQNLSASGAVGFSGLATQGSSLLQFQTGDVLRITTSVANGNALGLALNFVVKKLQDVVSHNGVSS